MSNKVMKNFRNSMRIPDDARWLMPGLQVKRWFALIFLGAVLMTLGVLILFDINFGFSWFRLGKNLPMTNIIKNFNMLIKGIIKVAGIQ